MIGVTTSVCKREEGAGIEKKRPRERRYRAGHGDRQEAARPQFKQ